MNVQLVWSAVIGFALIVLVFVMAARRRRPAAARYKAKGALCSPTEAAFLAALEAALPRSQRAFAQVRLIDVIEPVGSDIADRNRVIGKQLDFVVCDRRSLNVLYAIELNDRSHGRRDRQERDGFLAEAMAGAGIPLYFFKAAPGYSSAGIRQQLFRNGQREEPGIDSDAFAATDEWPSPY